MSAAVGGHFPPALLPASAQGEKNGREPESQGGGKKSRHKTLECGQLQVGLTGGARAQRCCIPESLMKISS